MKKMLILLIITEFFYSCSTKNSMKIDVDTLKDTKKIILKNNSTTIKVLTEKSSKFYQKADYKNALIYLKKALDISKKIFNKNDPNIAGIYNNMGSIYNDMGNYSKSLNYYQKSLEISEKIFDKNNPYLSIIYNNIGLIYQVMGEYPKALKYYQKSLVVVEKVFDKNNSYYSTIYNNIGSIYQAMGEYQKALIYLKKSLLIAENNFGKNHPKTAIKYYTIGSIYRDMKDYQKALIYYQKSSNINEIIFGKKNFIVAVDYIDIGLTHKLMGNYSKALVYLEKSLTINKKNFKEHPNTATNYNNIGLVYYAIGNYSKALNYYQKSLTINKKIFWKRHPHIATDYYNIGLTYNALGDYEKAYENIKKAFNIRYYNRKENFQILSQKGKKNYSKLTLLMSSLFENSYLYKELDKQKTKVINKEMLNNWLNYKRTIFDIDNNLKLLYKKTKSKTVKLKIDKLYNSQRKLARLYQNIPKNNKKIINETKENISKLEIWLSSKSPRLFTKNINYQEIINLLKPNELYIDFVKVEENYYYFTLDKKNNIFLKKFNTNQSTKIDSIIEEIQNDSFNISKGVNFSNLAKAKKQYSALYDLIIKDINLKNKTSLIISPDGLLGLIPFEAFYDKKEQKFLIQKVKIKYIPSGKELVKLHKDNSQTQSSDIVVFADVNFDNKNSKSQKTKGIIFNSLQPVKHLQYSRQDAMVVKKLFPNHTKLFLKKRATEENLLKVNAPKILYLSTHGTFLRDKSILNPMLKSIILLDGANESIRQKRGNGIVSGLELAGLNLQSTELVVLSACETGFGEIEDGEGVAGLSKAFMVAGAKNVIMTLWSVNDKKSSELMERFFEGVKNGLGYSDALREAKIWMIEERGQSHPYYWSGFVGSGRD